MRKTLFPIGSLALAAGLVALAASNADSSPALVNYVELQGASPGTVQTGHANLSGTVRAGSFVGNGQGITGLNGSNIANGLINHRRLPNNVARYNWAGNWTMPHSFPLNGVTIGTNQLVTKNGRVGINVSNPAVSLEVADIFRLSDAGARKVEASIFDTRNNGQLFTFSGTNSLLTGLGISEWNGGFVSIHDQSGGLQAGMYVNSANQGYVFGDIKAFKVVNPRDPRTDIWYAAVEGPEAAMYTRGKGSLRDGAAVINLPEHFRDMLSEGSLTVQLTPMSGDSEGLAVVDPNPDGIIIRELRKGRGNYEFYWEVKGVRKGRENFEVVRPWDSDLPANLDREALWRSRLESNK
ncbi:MAG TPA: hypothetical protein PKA27_07585 [Fimbriimonadaceae bacterium]|nr:hypothetical protein [Fimbriimonadaceae bacterium]